MLNVHLVIDNEKKRISLSIEKAIRIWGQLQTRIWYTEDHVSVYWKMKCVVTEHENAIVEEVYCQQLWAKEALQWTGHSLLNTYSPSWQCKVTLYKTKSREKKIFMRKGSTFTPSERTIFGIYRFTFVLITRIFHGW